MMSAFVIVPLNTVKFKSHPWHKPTFILILNNFKTDLNCLNVSTGRSSPPAYKTKTASKQSTLSIEVSLMIEMEDWNSVTLKKTLMDTESQSLTSKGKQTSHEMPERRGVYLKKARHFLFPSVGVTSEIFKYLLFFKHYQYLQNAQDHFVHSDSFPASWNHVQHGEPPPRSPLSDASKST